MDLEHIKGVTGHVRFLLQLSGLFPRMGNLVDVTGTVGQAPIAPTVLSTVLPPTAAVQAGATVNREALSHMFTV